MKEFVDQMNTTIRLSGVPRRIVSLVPSQTELLFHLGLGDRVVGITKFCIHPIEWYNTKSRVGGTKDVDFEKVKSLNPDLIIGNKEENERSNIEDLKSIAPVWMSDIFTLEDALEMILKLGKLVGAEKKSIEISSKIQTNFEYFEVKKSKFNKRPSVLYLIWKKPYIAVGKNTFIDNMLSRCGFENSITEERYPEINFETTNEPDFIFLSSEPYPFKENHISELQMVFPKAKISLVDGEMFSWYGSRLIEAPKYFESLFKN
jgi:ABC-type Fe3+-hydroxamate transport system substrate-binding protein